MTAKPATAVIPPPEHEYPTCPLCFATTTHDGDGLTCESCGIGWSDGRWDREGFLLDEDRPQCAAESNPWPGDPNIGHYRYRCVYFEGHGQTPPNRHQSPPPIRHAGGRIHPPTGGADCGAHVWYTTQVPVPA